MSERGNIMGTSKEGVMSVREKINSVLNEFFSEEDDSPLLICNSVGENSSVVPTAVGKSDHETTLLVTSATVDGTCKVGLAKSSSEAQMSPKSKNTSGGDVILESSGSKAGGTIVYQCYDKGDSTYFILQNLLARQLGLIRSLQKRLSNAESKRETISQEREQLQVALDRERQQTAEIRSESEVIIRRQEVKIQELQQQLQLVELKATCRNPSEDKATCVTPPAPRTSPTTQRPMMTMTASWEDVESVPPVPKRPRIDVGQREANSKLLPPPPKKTFIASSQSPGTTPYHPRRSDSPPQLSPAVTPKSITILNVSERLRDVRSYLGPEVANDDSVAGPPDEFQDELERFNTLRSPQKNHNRTGATFCKHLPVSHNAQRSSTTTPSSSYTSSASCFSQGTSLTNKPRHTRFIFHEGKRRFVNHSNDSCFQPLNKFRFPYSSALPSSISKSSHMNICASQHSGRNRSNNFLNLNRPLMKKAPVVIIPPPQPEQPQLIPSSSFHFRSLDGTAAVVPGTATHKSQQRQRSEEAKLMPSKNSPLAVVKKRKVGRPPGSGLKSKRLSLLPSECAGAGGSLGSPRGQLSNGADLPQQHDQICPPPVPQRFSQRGRLLKPNRARYSPDPTISVSVNSREKFMTMKKGYFMGQPFSHQIGYSEDQVCDDENVHILEEVDDSESRMDPSCMEIEDKLYTLQASSVQANSNLSTFEDGLSGSALSSIFVEVPKWRVSTVEEFSDEEERTPNDDMSDEAFLKRHQKLEAKEKQRKRWDSQRMREESYLERLKRKQEERERLKELRRQQRKRKGRHGASEEESVTPSAEEIKAIHIGSELPVGAFGHPLPLVEKVDFKLVWEMKPSATNTTTTTETSSPPASVSQNNTVADENMSKLMNECDITAIPVAVQPTKEACSSGVPSPFRIAPSSPSSSSLSLPSPGTSTPPPVIFPVFEEESFESSNYCDDDSTIEANNDPETTNTRTEVNGCIVVENDSQQIDSGTDCEHGPDSPIYSVDLVDYVQEPDLIDAESASADTFNENVQTSPVCGTPSISIPLQKHSPPSKFSQRALDGVSSTNDCSNPQRATFSAVVHFPQIANFSNIFSQVNSSRSTTSSATSSSSQPLCTTPGVSKTSITFFIPNNPLAPRHRQTSSTSPNKNISLSLATPSVFPKETGDS